jgi:hypothetical protein
MTRHYAFATVKTPCRHCGTLSYSHTPCPACKRQKFATTRPGPLYPRTIALVKDVQCAQCEFTTHSPVGLKIHTTSKHDPRLIRGPQ